MLRNTAIALAAASLFVAASLPTGALASGRGVGGHWGGGFGHGGFAGSGFAHSFAGRGFVGHGFGHGHHFGRFGVPFALGLGLGYGAYSYYSDPCYAWINTATGGFAVTTTDVATRFGSSCLWRA
jgi:hypothetical protein